MSQTDLAKIVGVSLRTVQLYEKKDANIPIKNLIKIAEHFDHSIAELYSYEANVQNGIHDSQNALTKAHHPIRPLTKEKFLITVPLVPGTLQAILCGSVWGEGFFGKSGPYWLCSG